MDRKDLKLLRRLSFVPRWSIMPTIRRQSVAEHTFGVITLVEWLLWYHVDGDDPSFQLLCIRYALEHDKDEALRGDAPSSSKAYVPPPDDLDQVKVVVKCADYLEAMLFIHEEQLMGNQIGTKYVQTDLMRRFHDYWCLFKTNATTRKSLTSDMIKDAKLLAFDDDEPHPKEFR